MSREFEKLRGGQPLQASWLNEVAGQVTHLSRVFESGAFDAGGGMLSPVEARKLPQICLGKTLHITDTDVSQPPYTEYPPEAEGEDNMRYDKFVVRLYDRIYKVEPGREEVDDADYYKDIKHPARYIVAQSLYRNYVPMNFWVFVVRLGTHWFILPLPGQAFIGRAAEEITAIDLDDDGHIVAGTGHVTIYRFVHKPDMYKDGEIEVNFVSNDNNLNPPKSDLYSTTSDRIKVYHLGPEPIAKNQWVHVKQEGATGRWVVDVEYCDE